MIFDEQKFSKELGELDLTNVQIKKIAYSILCFCDNWDSIVNIWKQYFYYTKTQEDKLALIFLAHEVIEQTARKKNKVFIVAFGDIFYEIFETLSKTITTIETIRQLIQLITHWEDKMYYSYTFTSKLKQMLIEKENVLKTDPNIQMKNDNDRAMLEMIMGNQSLRLSLELAIEEKNIKNIYDRIDFEKVNTILASIEPPNHNTQGYIKNFEDKILEMKKMLLEDLSKREYYTMQITEMLNREKETYFNLEENKK